VLCEVCCFCRLLSTVSIISTLQVGGEVEIRRWPRARLPSADRRAIDRSVESSAVFAPCTTQE
jgi:hypothetical protein